MPSSFSLATRALVAVALTAVFYLLAIAIVVGLLLIPYMEYAVTGDMPWKLGLFGALGAWVILWSIFPLRDRFVPPGPALDPKRQRRLFDALREAAGAAGQSVPSEVYLTPEQDAWVAERGGTLGLGARRVVGLGLPLLQAISISELRAVLALQFGHVNGRSGGIAPFVHRTRIAITRTRRGLPQHGSGSLKIPFLLYGDMFLRVTQAIARQQEMDAEALAARAFGARALAGGLRAIQETVAAPIPGDGRREEDRPAVALLEDLDAMKTALHRRNP